MVFRICMFLYKCLWLKQPWYANKTVEYLRCRHRDATWRIVLYTVGTKRLLEVGITQSNIFRKFRNIPSRFSQLLHNYRSGTPIEFEQFLYRQRPPYVGYTVHCIHWAILFKEKSFRICARRYKIMDEPISGFRDCLVKNIIIVTWLIRKTPI